MEGKWDNKLCTTCQTYTCKVSYYNGKLFFGPFVGTIEYTCKTCGRCIVKKFDERLVIAPV